MELVFATDSRLSGGQNFDAGTKLFDLPRTDALLAFAGDTAYAYPLALHLIASIKTYSRNLDRLFPLPKLRGQMLRVFNQVYCSIYNFPSGQKLPVEDEPRVHFLFGGRVWQTGEFKIWYIKLNATRTAFEFGSARNCHFIGDAEAVKEARSSLHWRLKEKGRTVSELDMEPFEVLRDMIRQGNHPRVGGAPQVAKVYMSLNSQVFATQWANSDGKVVPHMYGRAIADNERINLPMFDPDTLRFSPRNS